MRNLNKLYALTLAFLMIFGIDAMVANAAGKEINLYVSPSGSDQNSGDINSPFLTLEAAKNKIRALKSEEDLSNTDIYVNVRSGNYNVGKFFLEKQDSGFENHPITYRAYNNEEVSLMGGSEIKSESWSVVSDEATLSRLPEEARGKVVKADLAALGFTKEQLGKMTYFGGFIGELYQSNTPILPMSVELFCDDMPQTIARYPNEGYTLIKNVVKNCVNWINEKGTRPANADPSGFIINYEGNRPERWTNAKEAKMYGCWTYDWCDSTVDLININTRKKELTSGQATAWGVKASDGIGGRYYVFNLLEEIDIPGEYYLDTETSTMYYYPDGDIKDHVTTISVSTEEIISIKEAENIVFENFKISSSRGYGIVTDHTNNICFNNCTVINTGNLAATINEGKNNGFINCEIYNTNGGICLNSSDGTMSLTPSGNYVVNSKIHDFARYKKYYNPGIMINGCGNYVAHNEIYNGPHFAIWLGDANDNIMEYNDIHDVLLDTSDAGAIYMGMSWHCQGNIIRYNYLHDFGNMPNLHAIYPDGGYCGLTVYGNVFKDLGKLGSAVMMTGRDHKITNNICINMGEASFRGWTISEPSRDSVVTDLKKRIEDPTYGSLWLSKYPQLADYLTGDCSHPTGNVIKDNISIDGPGLMLTPEYFTYGDVKEDTIVKKDQVSYTVDSNGKITVEQDKIKAFIPSWEVIDTENIGITDEIKSMSEFKDSDESGDKLSDAVVLALGKSGALAFGKSVQIDSQNAEVYPQIVNDRTLVPVRFISENFGAAVEWNEETKTVTLSFSNKTVNMTIGESRLLIDGNETQIDVAPTIIESRTMIPLRALCETALGKSVFWDPKGLIVVSERENILDSTADAEYIDTVLDRLSVK